MKIVAAATHSCNSVMSGKGYLLRIVHSLSCRYTTYNRNLQSGLGTKRMGAPAGDLL